MRRVWITLATFALWSAGLPAPAAAQSGAPAPAHADTLAPDWLGFDAEAKKIDLKITAALTPLNGGWNFNGYVKGDLKITVPLGWRVSTTFVSRDGNVPHSVGVIEADPSALPPSGEQAKVALRGAYSYPFTQGSSAYKEQTFDFTASKAGTFILYCGVPGHAASGMWNYFAVEEGIDRPVATARKQAGG